MTKFHDGKLNYLHDNWAISSAQDVKSVDLSMIKLLFPVSGRNPQAQHALYEINKQMVFHCHARDGRPNPTPFYCFACCVLYLLTIYYNNVLDAVFFTNINMILYFYYWKLFRIIHLDNRNFSSKRLSDHNMIPPEGIYQQVYWFIAQHFMEILNKRMLKLKITVVFNNKQWWERKKYQYNNVKIVHYNLKSYLKKYYQLNVSIKIKALVLQTNVFCDGKWHLKHEQRPQPDTVSV